MIIIYEAYDGTRFDNEFDCESYEGLKIHNHLQDITFYNKKGNSYKINDEKLINIFDEKIYNDCYKIDIHNESELKDILWLSDFIGWCEFDSFTAPGRWVRREDDMNNGYWILEDKI